MKKILAILLLSVLLVSCGEYEPEENKVDIKDELKISAYLLNEDLEDSGYWAYSEDLQYMNQGYWVSDDGREYDDDEVFAFEELEVGEVRTLAPLGYNRMHNLNLFIDFEGIVEVEPNPLDDDRIRLTYSLDFPTEPWQGRTIEAESIRTSAPFTLSVYPVGKNTNADRISSTFTLTDNEYDLIIRAYDYSDTLLVTAKIKLVALDDEHFPSEQFSNWVFAANEEKTRFLTIELVSYEYSDIYKLDESMYEE